MSCAKSTGFETSPAAHTCQTQTNIATRHKDMPWRQADDFVTGIVCPVEITDAAIQDNHKLR